MIFKLKIDPCFELVDKSESFLLKNIFKSYVGIRVTWYCIKDIFVFLLTFLVYDLLWKLKNFVVYTSLKTIYIVWISPTVLNHICETRKTHFNVCITLLIEILSIPTFLILSEMANDLGLFIVTLPIFFIVMSILILYVICSCMVCCKPVPSRENSNHIEKAVQTCQWKSGQYSISLKLAKYWQF